MREEAAPASRGPVFCGRGLIAATQRTDRSVFTDSLCSVDLCREALKPLKAEHFNGF